MTIHSTRAYSNYISQCNKIMYFQQTHKPIIHTENSNKMQQCNKFIPYLYEAQHVSGDTPPIIRSLKLH